MDTEDMILLWEDPERNVYRHEKTSMAGLLAVASIGLTSLDGPHERWRVDPVLHAREIIPAPPKPLTKRQKRRLRGKVRSMSTPPRSIEGEGL